MKLRSLLLWIVMLATLAVGGLQIWKQQQTRDQLAWFSGYAQAMFNLRYDELWAPLVGPLELRSVYLTAGRLLRESLSLPGGYYLQADTLYLDEFRSDNSRPELLALRLEGLRLPTPDWLSRGTDARFMGMAILPLANLAYTELRGGAQLNAAFSPGSRALGVAGDIELEDFARLQFNLELDVDERIMQGWPDDGGLRSLSLTLRDGGFLERYKGRVAQRRRINLAAAEAELLRELDDYAQTQQLRWSDESAAAARRFLHRGGQLKITMLPLAGFELRNLQLYPLGEWPVLLGLELSHSD